MSEDLGETIQGMFRSIYEAVDKKYLRPLKVRTHKVGSSNYILRHRLTVFCSNIAERNVQMWYHLFR